MPRSLGEVWIGDSYVVCGWVSSPLAVTSSTGCAGNNAVGKGARICFDSLEHKALEDADLLEHQRVLKSGTHICGPGVGAEGTLYVKVCLPELNFFCKCLCVFCLSGLETQNLVDPLCLSRMETQDVLHLLLSRWTKTLKSERRWSLSSQAGGSGFLTNPTWPLEILLSRWTKATWITPGGERNTAGNALESATDWGKGLTVLLYRVFWLLMSNPWRIRWSILELG